MSEGLTGKATPGNEIIGFYIVSLIGKVLLNRFRKMNIEDARKEFDLGEDVQEWKVQWAQDDINKNAVINNAVDPKLA